MIMVFTVGSIIAVQLANNNQWTGVPSTLVLVGAALVAYPVGRLMDWGGRRIGLSLGHIFGVTGAIIAGWAVVQESLLIFLLGIFFIGLAKGVIDLGRYAAAEATPPSRRARAISLVVLGGTVGSITGPSLLEFTGNLATRLELPALSGPWLGAGFFYLLALLIVNLFLRPDPQLIGRQLAALEPSRTAEAERVRPFREIFSNPQAKLAIGALIFGQLTMVLLMTVTPVHMHDHHHQISAISWVIMAHTLGMFGFSVVTGWLVDKLGRDKMILIGGLVLILACLTAPLSVELPGLIVALFLLGLGWNFCFVAGSTLLADILRNQEKGRAQGLVDTLINVTSAVGSLSSGLALTGLGFISMSLGTVLVAGLPIMLVLLFGAARRKVSLEGTIS